MSDAQTALAGQSNPDRQRSTNPDYKVGYKKPPLATRFKKGRSGNPKGRPKANGRIGDSVSVAAEEHVRVLTARGPKNIPIREAIITTLLNAALKGDQRAQRLFLKHAARAGNLEPTAPARSNNVLVMPDLHRRK